MAQKTAEIKPKNGRWPTDFLNGQLVKLVSELSGCETWNERSAINLREPVEDYVIAGNEADRAPVDMRHHISALELECSAQKVLDIRTALVLITRDLKSDGAHNYAKCLDCEEHIASHRLIASPWAQKCLTCQEASEPDFRRESRTLKAKPYSPSIRPRNGVRRGSGKMERFRR